MFASIVSNTSLTLADVKNMTVIEFEELLEGMNLYSEEVEKQMAEASGGSDKLQGGDAIEYLLNNFGM